MAVATAGRAGAPLVQRLVIALAVLVAVGVVVSNARMVVHFMADQQATFVGGWSHAQWSPDEARSAADARKLESVASRVRAGGLKLIGRTRAQFLADLHTPLGPGVGTGASDELDGVLLVEVLNTETEQSYLCIAESTPDQLAIIARVQAPMPINFGLHCTWVDHDPLRIISKY